MKELSIEEKARRYDEAIEKLRNFYRDYDTVSCLIDAKEELANLFSELKESEDDRIKKKIIATIHLYYGEPLEEEAKEMIAWLEKQGEHAKFRDSIQVGDKVTRNQDGMLVNLSQLNRVAKKDEKQGDDKVEQKPWSEEDEMDFDVIYGIIYNSCNAEDASRLIEWLKSLKERVQPQPKQEWSEEDEDIKDSIIHQLKMLRGDRNVTEGNKKEIEWLQSLKDRYAFKPSEEQLNGLKEAIEFLGCTKTRREQLQSLYEQLKKLREEKL